MPLTIIHSREKATLASSWTEHICLRQLEHGLYELSERKWDVLGEANQYCNEDGELELPETIDGKVVVSVEDGYICGGELLYANDDVMDDRVLFRDLNSPSVTDWLKSKGLPSSQVLPLVRTAIGFIG